MNLQGLVLPNSFLFLGVMVLIISCVSQQSLWKSLWKSLFPWPFLPFHYIIQSRHSYIAIVSRIHSLLSTLPANPGATVPIVSCVDGFSSLQSSSHSSPNTVTIVTWHRESQACWVFHSLVSFLNVGVLGTLGCVTWDLWFLKAWGFYRSSGEDKVTSGKGLGVLTRRGLTVKDG